MHSSAFHPSPTIVVEPDDEAVVPAIAQTCRQVRDESLSQKLATCPLVLESNARTDDGIEYLDAKFQRCLDHLLLKTDVSVSLCPISGAIDSSRHRTGKLCAISMNGQTSNTCAQFSFAFVNEWPNIAFFKPFSLNEIRKILVEIYSDEVIAGCADLVRAVYRIKKLGLNLWVNLASSREFDLDVIEWRFVIFSWPRRLEIIARRTKSQSTLRMYESFFDTKELNNSGIQLLSEELNNFGPDPFD